ncbi:nuclear intron maturase 3, mitochondrial isoform X2 [Nymphaea colorata]|uniref:nuclear intron maturase 3, mitochondrial isoform X2 n=1 Tax=Nymphaea colorata TaxID=210225 RepID=UPI00129E7CA4|nr:nuclear intron maturase 3, mitochondrial isoform X2 [Nymphaea colorata]
MDPTADNAGSSCKYLGGRLVAAREFFYQTPSARRPGSVAFMLKRLGFNEIGVGLCSQVARRFYCGTTEMKSKKDIESLVLKQYKNGRFHNLVSNVIAVPSILFAACENLSVGRKGGELRHLLFCSEYRGIDWRWIENTCQQLKDGNFNMDLHCVRMIPIRIKGESLALPNLKLKVVIEAIRMVLEVIYEKRFMTFAYGGRVGMGRHTAVRYLKTSVDNPNWWFRLRFSHEKFDDLRVKKLISIMEEKISDSLLMDLISNLFLSEAVCIEFGGCYMGKGLLQESGLSAILVNIYLNGLDREIQNLRSQISRARPGFELVGEIGVQAPSGVKDWVREQVTYRDSKGLDNMFYKPVKLFACRYLDDVLVICSGSKILTMRVKDLLVEFSECSLGLKIDRLNTAIHSAVSEKIEFLGLEFQVVPPSVLQPPLSEKAIRAKKKYIKQRQARAMEERNALETRRKKLGMKIVNHVFKKYKRSGGFKGEPTVAPVAREMFGTWAKEVIQEFLDSPDECWEWHHKLTSGDFLHSQSVRDLLPQDLLDAYDQFQVQVDKYLNPEKMKETLTEETQLEDEYIRYSKRTVDDLTKLCMKVDAPLELMRNSVKLARFTNAMGRPRPIRLLIPLEDADIVKWYAGIGMRWLDFYCCCHNFRTVKTIVNYHLRFSCILTLAEKHESSKRDAIKHYSKDLKVSSAEAAEEIYFPIENDIKMMGDKNLSDPKPVDGLLCMAFVRLASDEPPSYCAAHFCNVKDTVAYRVRLLQSRLNINPFDEKKWVSGVAATQESIDRKCLPLCKQHITDLYLGRITLQDVDCTSCFGGH